MRAETRKENWITGRRKWITGRKWKMDVLHEGDNAAIWTAGLCLLWYF